MRPTTLGSSVGDGLVRCDVCQWRCEVAPGDAGRCLVRRNDGGTLMALNDGLISAATIAPIEDHGFLHFFPESIALALGSWGTPFPKEQERSTYAFMPETESGRRVLEAERAVRFAQERLCRGIVWTYNDPLMEFEYLYDGVRLARAASRYTAIVSGGYWTIEALDRLGPYLDGINLRLFGFSDDSYAALAGVPQWRGIIDAARRALRRWRCHLEITYLLQPGANDSVAELQALAAWVREQLIPIIPIHVMPAQEGSNAGIAHARQVLRQEGLKFVYGPDRTETTRCPSCGWPVIERPEGIPKLIGVEQGLCDNCGADLYLRRSMFKPLSTGGE